MLVESVGLAVVHDGLALLLDCLAHGVIESLATTGDGLVDIDGAGGDGHGQNDNDA